MDSEGGGNATCTAAELKAKLDEGAEILVLDVRTDEEVEIAALEGACHIPLHELEDRLDELEPYRAVEIVALCHHGIRSWHAQAFLLESGFPCVRNLLGGIDAYAVEADPAVPRYG